jgi:hypothetical protein
MTWPWVVLILGLVIQVELFVLLWAMLVPPRRVPDDLDVDTIAPTLTGLIDDRIRQAGVGDTLVKPPSKMTHGELAEHQRQAAMADEW